MEINKEIDKYECPNCNKTIIENNLKNFYSNDLIIKSKLIFLNEDGKVLGKCSSCKKIISLPLDFSKENNQINQKQVIDL